MPVTMDLLNFSVVLLLATSLACAHARPTIKPKPKKGQVKASVRTDEDNPDFFSFPLGPANAKPELLVERMQSFDKPINVIFDPARHDDISTVSEVTVSNQSSGIEKVELLEQPSGSTVIGVRITPKSTFKQVLATVSFLGEWKSKDHQRINTREVVFEGLSFMTFGGRAGIDP